MGSKPGRQGEDMQGLAGMKALNPLYVNELLPNLSGKNLHFRHSGRNLLNAPVLNLPDIRASKVTQVYLWEVAKVC